MYYVKYKDQIIAQEEDVIEDCGTKYFPLQAVDQTFLVESNFRSSCLFKNTATYYHVKVGNDLFENAAWTYLDPDPEKKEIKGRIAFAEELLDKQ
ncbi:DUF427 domain-containing protein [Flammeovirga agarivorans]|uniref:DUF427 domain-containing protein n=1 Tax=Flammeovirga agarivorans TaxID=2726742 RepID=A0A7X8SK64_9BACT|nr:DUF427 domain-containing protein [Flammeovirga agarivorans]NLR91628.1 DUF427 domain-containing protein [Flammeovirga agarivorans]